jgi:hypothetical protein
MKNATVIAIGITYRILDNSKPEEAKVKTEENKPDKRKAE